jgi:hypothetical protein
MTSAERRIVWRFGLRPQLFIACGALLTLAIASILNINEPDERQLLFYCIGGPFGMIGFLAIFWDMLKDARRQWQQQDAEWDRLVNVQRRDANGASESN